MAMLLAVPGCQTAETDREQVSRDQGLEIPDQVFEGFEMTITEDGIKKGWVQGERAERYESRKIFTLSRPKVIFYSPSGAVQSVMTSLRGLIQISSGDMEAYDSVVVISADSSKILETRHLVWKKSENLIVGDSAVVIRAKGRGILYGDGIVSDAGFDNVEVKNPTGDINVLGERP
ncbi:MAG: LPS export ABC transporter periplasmic protein LptC [Candidatus Glassbacteria bacterium]|nr:LPS export ABC transporter periplasmic protein LptC [Candidatus Glassbacteria bacterium]